MKFETAFIMDTFSIKFGLGVTREVGYDMHALGARRGAVFRFTAPTNPELY